jgi:hypothetical protein
MSGTPLCRSAAIGAGPPGREVGLASRARRPASGRGAQPRCRRPVAGRLAGPAAGRGRRGGARRQACPRAGLRPDPGDRAHRLGAARQGSTLPGPGPARRLSAAAAEATPVGKERHGVTANGQERGSGHSARSSRPERAGMMATRSAHRLRASGHRTAHTGRIHDRSRPACRNADKVLPRGPCIRDKWRCGRAPSSSTASAKPGSIGSSQGIHPQGRRWLQHGSPGRARRRPVGAFGWSKRRSTGTYARVKPGNDRGIERTRERAS